MPEEISAALKCRLWLGRMTGFYGSFPATGPLFDLLLIPSPCCVPGVTKAIALVEGMASSIPPSPRPPRDLQILQPWAAVTHVAAPGSRLSLVPRVLDHVLLGSMGHRPSYPEPWGLCHGRTQSRGARNENPVESGRAPARVCRHLAGRLVPPYGASLSGPGCYGAISRMV